MACKAYYTVAFRATGYINLTCDLPEQHEGLHFDRTRVYWSTDRPTDHAPSTPEAARDAEARS